MAREPGKRNSFLQYIAEHSKVAKETEQNGKDLIKYPDDDGEERRIKKKLIREGPIGRGEKI